MSPAAQMIAEADERIAELEARLRTAEDTARLEGFADCEALVVAMLEGMAASEAARAGLSGTTSDRLGNLRGSRALALREAALAVSLGQHRTAEMSEAVTATHRAIVNRAQASRAGSSRSKPKAEAGRRNLAKARAAKTTKGESE